MKRSILLIPILIALASMQSHAATPAQEKAFVDSYRKALEAGDAKTLAGYLLTDGATPDTVEFFKMTQALGAGAKVVSIELTKPDAAETAKFGEAMTIPDGKSYKT